jgi:hypothetical protein
MVVGGGPASTAPRRLAIGWRWCRRWLPRRVPGRSVPREVSGQRTGAGDHPTGADDTQWPITFGGAPDSRSAPSIAALARCAP